MAGSRRGTADWHFATGHFGRKRAIRRRGRGASGGGDAPAAGTGRVSGTAEEVRAEEVRAEEEHRPLARGPVGDAGVPAATRVYRRRRGCTGGEKEGRQQKGENSGRWHGAGRQGGRGGAPAASARRVGGTSEEVHRPLARGPVDRATEEEHRPLAQGGSAEQQRRCGRQRRSSGCERKAGQRNGGEGADGGGAPAGGTPGSGTQKGLRYRRPVSGGPDYIYYRFCSPRIRIATSRIVVSSNVTTPPSGPGSK